MLLFFLLASLSISMIFRWGSFGAENIAENWHLMIMHSLPVDVVTSDSILKGFNDTYDL